DQPEAPDLGLTAGMTDADGLGQDVTETMRGDVLGRDRSEVGQLLGPGMISGEMVKRPPTEQVDSRVADVGDGEARAETHGRGQSRPHPREPRITLRLLE